jgi:RES domain-containing protein
MLVYRLVKARYAERALDGAGAKTHGGRWNGKGTAMVYASDSVALSALELLVHLQRQGLLNAYVLFTLSVPDSRVMVLDRTLLPADWRRDPPPASTAAIGDEWVASGLSPALSVPSTLIPQQSNILLNPGHPDFAAVAAEATREPFDFDPRLLK